MELINDHPVITNLWPDELKILIIDDEQDTLNLIRLSLELAGFRVIRTTKPEEGLDLALKENPDLLILDIMMPGLDGFELLRRIRRNAKVQPVPAIIVSALANSEIQLRMLKLTQSGASDIDAYISKPFNPALLLKTVKHVLMCHKDYLVEKHRLTQKSLPARQTVYQ